MRKTPQVFNDHHAYEVARLREKIARLEEALAEYAAHYGLSPKARSLFAGAAAELGEAKPDDAPRRAVSR